jgi:hypothetical protein
MVIDEEELNAVSVDDMGFQNLGDKYYIDAGDYTPAAPSYGKNVGSVTIDMARSNLDVVFRSGTLEHGGSESLDLTIESSALQDMSERDNRFVILSEGVLDSELIQEACEDTDKHVVKIDPSG